MYPRELARTFKEWKAKPAKSMDAFRKKAATMWKRYFRLMEMNHQLNQTTETGTTEQQETAMNG